MMENYVDAYYKFLALYDAYPTDVDAKLFLDASKEKLKNHYFYRDETFELQPFETYRGVHFKYYLPNGSYNVVFIRGITFLQEAGKLVLYLRGLSIFTYSDDDILLAPRLLDLYFVFLATQSLTPNATALWLVLFHLIFLVY